MMPHEVSQRAPDVEWGWEALGGHTAPGALLGPQGPGGAFGALVGPKRFFAQFTLVLPCSALKSPWGLGALLGALVGPKRFLRSLRLSYLATLRGPWDLLGPLGPFLKSV